MRKVFYNSYNYLNAEKELLDNKRRKIPMPENLREYIAIYSTVADDSFYVDCITNKEIVQIRREIKGYTELELELLMNTDDNSAIIQKSGIIKIRNLDKSIGNTLKDVYGHKCQICGLFLGELYDATVINTHHIDYFSKSLNINAENIMIISQITIV